MRILGIDYGRKKIGLAIADGSLAEPWKVIRFNSVEEILSKIEKELEIGEVEKIIVGISEGAMAVETRRFGKKLKEKFKIPVFFQDETLTTHEAQVLSIKAGIKRKKRKELEDAFAATLILQGYLDKS